jgi:hypothetical protein
MSLKLFGVLKFELHFESFRKIGILNASINV